MLSINKTTRIFFYKLRQLTLAALLVFAGGVQADALDVYMGTGQTSAAETHPNVLFILDTSGSMNARDAGSNKRTARMTVLKSAMSDLLSTLDNVNVGLARFSNTGGSVIFPISPINGNANIIVGESTSVQALEFKASLVNNTDDAEERVSGNSTGEVFLHDDTLEAFDFGGTTGQSGTTTVLVASASDDISEFNRNGRMLNTNFAYIHQVVSLGLRFQSVNIAQGATIQSAFLEFTNAFRQTTRTNAVISGLDIANTTTFSTSSRDLSSRATTSATVAWDGIPGGNRIRNLHHQTSHLSFRRLSTGLIGNRVMLWVLKSKPVGALVFHIHVMLVVHCSQNFVFKCRQLLVLKGMINCLPCVLKMFVFHEAQL